MEIVETPIFTRRITELLPDPLYRELQEALVLRPDQGDLIPGSGGLRKIRWNAAGKGNAEASGFSTTGPSLAISFGCSSPMRRPIVRIWSRSSWLPCAKRSKGGTMDKALFDELLESVGEMDRIARGDAAPARLTSFPEPDVQAIREQTGLSQSRFAQAIGVSQRTLENWEQKRRKPTGPAKALLRIVEADPRTALRNLRITA